MRPFDTALLQLQTLQAAGAGAENIITVTDATREKRANKTVDSGEVKQNIGKEQEQEADIKSASQRSRDQTVTPDKETKDKHLTRPVRIHFSNS